MSYHYLPAHVSQLITITFFFFFFFFVFFCFFFCFFFFKQKTAYEIVSRDWSSDVCSSDLGPAVEIRKARFADYISVLSNARFMVLTLFAAIPAKIALTGFLYYTGPLYMSSLGTDQSSIGRVMMAYGIAMIALSPIIRRLADRLKHRAILVTVGGLMSSMALMLLYFENSITAVLASITLLGVAHAIGVSPQITLMTEISKEHAAEIGIGTTIGIFRLVERLGNVAGPIISGILITVYGYPGAFVGIAAITFMGIITFAGAFLVFHYQNRQSQTVLAADAGGLSS